VSKSSLLDKYYKSPLLYDLIIIVLVILSIIYLTENDIFDLYFDCESKEIAGIGITISGFILTILTILLTLKSNSIESKRKKGESNSFKIFLASPLYSKSVIILKNGVLTLLIVSFITLGFSIFFERYYCEYGVYANIVCIIFILLVFLRSFYILNLIFKMQNIENDN